MNVTSVSRTLIRVFFIGLLCFIALIFFWLVTKSQRFGPVIEIEETNHTNYFDNIIQNSRFIFNKGNKDFLLDPLRDKAI